MNFEEFKKEIVGEIKKRIGKGEVKIENIIKNNGVNLTGLVLICPDRKLSPTIYLEPYFEKMKEKSFIQIADDIWQTYLKNRDFHEIDVSQFTDWNKAKNRVTVKLINYADNQELLNSIPHEKYLDLAIVYYYLVDIFEGRAATILINNYHLELWGIKKDEIHNVAVSNYKKLYHIKVEDIQDIVAEFLKDIADEKDDFRDDMGVKMYVVTNHFKLYGATAMLFLEEFKKLANDLECDLYILPSSVHEVIALAAKKEETEFLKKVVCYVNRNQVDRVEQLSNNIYHYVRENEKIQIA